MRGLEDEVLAERLLILRAQLGGREAWAQLAERYDPRLAFYLRRLLGPTADAEDARQDVWLTVVRKLNTLEEPAAFRTWLYRIARHRAISMLRKRRREVPLDLAGPTEEIAQEQAAEEETGFSPEEAAAMYAALGGLSLAHREVLSLRFLGGLSYEEIGRVVECGVGTVRSRLHYAKLALRAALPRTLERETQL